MTFARSDGEEVQHGCKGQTTLRRDCALILSDVSRTSLMLVAKELCKPIRL
jgi:hypothetical protein